MEAKNYRVRKDDKVQILAGKDKGKVGKVLKVLKKRDCVIVEKVNVVKRHTRGNPYSGQAGGILDKEAPIHVSNVAVVCDACTKATRVGYRYTEDGTKVRFCKKCNEIIKAG
ncbi:ribosomal protein L24 [Alkalidesulfovibrio alkalitolerans DSM 16529]|jgi:large subunit ribosomal protein L24|uniref:Large ribosomal subunit protein uL24 n=1 Tax=Alkalidesulfovibrio alkalitolerans DSM 16529 TaxID=1121439 RepID=S7TDJ2_9BACT|nr:50S ribosomal protein L24 [Alkalidesulfovibrio alkalitolerans]EPR34721.1 ribosomal protein L24 [Alkalidesulfovibrio alkalitolerans DSM 16529]